MRLTPQNYPVVIAAIPQAASTATTASNQAINMKNANGVLIIASHSGTANNDMTLIVCEGATAAEANAGTYALAVESAPTTGSAFQIWANAAVATNDILVKQTDGVTYNINSDAGGTYLVCLYVSAACMTHGRNWLVLGTDAGHASNFFSAIYILDGARYEQTTPPTVVA